MRKYVRVLLNFVISLSMIGNYNQLVDVYAEEQIQQNEDEQRFELEETNESDNATSSVY